MGTDLSALPPHLRDAAAKQIEQQRRRERAPQPPRRRNKYNTAPTDQRKWRGRTYDSKAEMEYAKQLHDCLDHGTMLEIVEQPSVALVEGFVYRPDFLAIHDGGANYIDVKGRETQRFRDVKRLWKAHGRLPLWIVQKKGGKFHVSEVIDPKQEAP